MMSMYRDGAFKTLGRLVLPLPLRMALWPVRQRLRQWPSHLQQWLNDCLPDRYVQASQFKQHFGRPLNFAAPTTFNEKLHWLMLNYRIPEMTQCADKYEVRRYVADRGCASILNDLYGVWDDPADMVFEQLPDTFVLKVTHGSGQNLICRDKSRLNVKSTRRQLAEWMRRSEYWVSREWAYKNIRPRIICERLLTDEQGAVPADFKFFCFNGEPRFIQVDTDRFTTHHRDIFDLDWTLLPFSLEFPSSGRAISRPMNLESMISAARALKQGFPFVRVDFYSMGARVIFGEMTWYPEGGLGRFTPDIYDLHVGEALTLPKPSSHPP
jgi:hypothetical protein